MYFELGRVFVFVVNTNTLWTNLVFQNVELDSLIIIYYQLVYACSELFYILNLILF